VGFKGIRRPRRNGGQDGEQNGFPSRMEYQGQTGFVQRPASTTVDMIRGAILEISTAYPAFSHHRPLTRRARPVNLSQMLDSTGAIRSPATPHRRTLLVPALAWLVLSIAVALPAAAEEAKLPLPRYASLDSGQVNFRAGPGETYPKLWLYQR